MAAWVELARQDEALDKHTPVLIGKADRFIDRMKAKKTNGIPGKRNRDGTINMIKKTPQSTQFTGLVEAGLKASCVEELELFIRYKEAKKGTAEDWAGLAEPLVALIKEVRALLTEEEIQKLPSAKPELELMLVQRFLGYLMWSAHVYGGGK